MANFDQRHQPQRSEYVFEALDPASCQNYEKQVTESSHAVDDRNVRQVSEWTAAEKKLLKYAFEINPRPISRKLCNKRVPEFMAWMTNVSKFVPGKTADDCASYYLRLHSSRVAYFGPSSSMATMHRI
jgi:hypothetical protein